MHRNSAIRSANQESWFMRENRTRIQQLQIIIPSIPEMWYCFRIDNNSRLHSIRLGYWCASWLRLENAWKAFSWHVNESQRSLNDDDGPIYTICEHIACVCVCLYCMKSDWVAFMRHVPVHTKYEEIPLTSTWKITKDTRNTLENPINTTYRVGSDNLRLPLCRHSRHVWCRYM